MSRLDDLIAELCPAGVRFEELGEVGEFIRGNGLQKKDLVETGVAAIHYGEIHTHYGTAAVSTKSFVDEQAAARLRKAQPGNLVIATTSEDDAAVAKAVAWIGGCDAVVSSDAYIYRHRLDPRYVSYYFQSEQFQAQKKRYVTGTKVRRISGDSLAKIKIPVPPLEMQKEIVDVLAKMERLEAELEAELEARRLQYQHYRESLLAFPETDKGRWAAFGDVATVVRGGSPRPIQAYLTDTEGGVSWIKIGDVPPGGKYITSTAEKITPEGAARSRRVEPGDFVLSNSMSFGRPYIVKIDGCVHDGWLVIKDFAGTFHPDFLYHLLRTSQVYNEMARRAGAGTVQNLNADIVKALRLPVLAIDEQERIAAILDKFDALVNDLSIGLPAELNARRKQYEHYRDRLLTFQEAA